MGGNVAKQQGVPVGLRMGYRCRADRSACTPGFVLDNKWLIKLRTKILSDPADDRLEVFDVTSGTPTLVSEIPVGLDPISGIKFRKPGQPDRRSAGGSTKEDGNS